jgi:hypothetical protein
MCVLCAIQHGTLLYKAKLLPGRSSAHLCDCGGCGRFRVISVSNYLLILWKRTKRMGRFLMMFDYFVNGFIMFNQG